MTIRKKIVFYFYILAVLVLKIQSPNKIYAQPSSPKPSPSPINALGAVLVEEDSMRILWEKNADIPLPMASTTKIMTCILALEQGKLEDIVVTSKRAAAAPKVKLYLRPGEKQSLGDLLYALMLQSSNDAAIAIAEHVGGSVEEFCEKMTKRAQELGAKSTCFKTPNGLDAPGHMSSPYDLALITKHAYQNPEFIKIINTSSKAIPSSPLEDSQAHYLQNKNRFLTSYEGANGVKTGFTGQAGHCFVGGAKQGNMQLFSVVLASGWGPVGSKRKYSDTISLLEYGFNNYKIVPIKQAMEQAGSLPVIKGDQDLVPLAYGESLALPLTQEEAAGLSISLDLPEAMNAPIKANAPIGVARVYTQATLLATIPIVTTASIEEKTISKSFRQVIQKWTNLLHK